MNDSFRIDLHTHTWFSGDALMSPRALVARARELGLDRVAVTDHGTLRGALEAKDLAPELIVIGEEMTCRCGSELIGLYLHEEIPNGLDVDATAREIRDQGGVVYVPHPFAYLRAPEERARRTAGTADILEVFNARAFFPPWNRRAEELRLATGLVGAAGSDAHLPWELGSAFCYAPPFDGADELRAILPSLRPHVVRSTSVFAHVVSTTTWGARHLLARSHGHRPLPTLGKPRRSRPARTDERHPAHR